MVEEFLPTDGLIANSLHQLIQVDLEDVDRPLDVLQEMGDSAAGDEFGEDNVKQEVDLLLIYIVEL